jgi:YVTN family beta-propeller protein
MYVAISGSDHTAVVDLQRRQVIDKIKVGARPARISTAILPVGRVNTNTGTNGGQAASQAPRGGDVEAYRKSVEPLFVRARGGTMPGYAACVMCHTWQTSLRFSLQTPATDAGWTADQSRANFDVVTKLVNTASPENSRLLLKPLAPSAGGLGHTGGTYWNSRDDPEYQAVLKWIRSLPAERYVQAPEPTLDFAFFRSCVQQVFAKPREGHIRCSTCHNAGLVGFAPAPENGREWNEAEAKRAFQLISRVIVPGNPDQSRFMLKPLHPDGGGSYAHNGVRRWQSRSDPEYQMLADWIRGTRTGTSCS